MENRVIDCSHINGIGNLTSKPRLLGQVKILLLGYHGGSGQCRIMR